MGGPKAKEFHNILLNSRNRNKMNVIIDLSDVSYVNSSGIGILVRGYTSMKNAGGDMKLAGSSEKVNKVLNITNLENVFEQYSNIEEAARSYNYLRKE